MPIIVATTPDETIMAIISALNPIEDAHFITWLRSLEIRAPGATDEDRSMGLGHPDWYRRFSKRNPA